MEGFSKFSVLSVCSVVNLPYSTLPCSIKSVKRACKTSSPSTTPLTSCESKAGARSRLSNTPKVDDQAGGLALAPPFNVKVNPANRAPKALATGRLVEFLDAQHEYERLEHLLFDKKEINLSATSGVWMGWVPINTLVGEGIGMLKAKLSTRPAEYQNHAREAINIGIVLQSVPTIPTWFRNF